MGTALFHIQQEMNITRDQHITKLIVASMVNKKWLIVTIRLLLAKHQKYIMSMNRITNKEKIALLNQALNYIDEDLTNESLISANLEELEGDYYTFFNPSFTVELKDGYEVSELTKSGLDFLFYLIGSINAGLWNVKSYKSEAIWADIRLVAKIVKANLNA